MRKRNNDFIIYIAQIKMADFEHQQLEIGLGFVH